MNTSIEYQIELLKKLSKELHFFSTKVNETTKKYKKYSLNDFKQNSSQIIKLDKLIKLNPKLIQLIEELNLDI